MRRGAFTIVTECFGMARLMVHCLWNSMHASGHIISLEFHSQKIAGDGLCIHQSSSMRESKTFHYRSGRLRKLATSLGVSKTAVHCWIVDSTIQVHSNSLKPVLMEENKVAWLLMALDSWDPQDPMKFLDMMDHIHMDEKWFFLSWQKERYLLLPEDKNLKWCVKSKSHITKVMFLCAIARPHFNPCANSWWDGKIGIWPIGDWEPAKRASKNQPRGTLVWKNKLVTKEVYRELLISKLLLAIVEKCPQMDWLSRKIWIQQHGTKSHISADDNEFKEALNAQEITEKYP